jgi:hypothetical protein
VGRREVCPSCGADLHCCLNCACYDPHAPQQCREPQAQRVSDKERGNFCDEFTPPMTGPELPGRAARPDVRTRLDTLLKDH